MIKADEWLDDTAIDKYNLDEECVKQPGLYGFWANQETHYIIEEDKAMVKLNTADNNLKVAKAKANANMRGLDLGVLNSLLGVELPRTPDVALWKELVLLHPDVTAAQAACDEAQKYFLACKHERLQRKTARRAMENKAQELNNLIYLANKIESARDSYTKQPEAVRTTRRNTIRRKAEDAMALQLKKRIKAD